VSDEIAGEEPLTRTSRTTLAEVAALARVSIGTVSKVLNGRQGVSPETRDRVDALLERRGYSRRTVLHRPAPLLEVLCFDIGGPFSAAMIAAIERVAREQGVGLVVSGAGPDHQPSARWVDDALHRQPRGIILILSELGDDMRRRLRSRDIPVVAINPFGAPLADVPSLGSADWNGGHLATRHLLELGHTRIGIIKGPEEMHASAARLSGYRTALETAGIPVRPEWIRPGRFIHSDGFEQGTALLSLPERPTAIFASSDLQGLGVYDAARAMGLDIPGDLSVVGYGDLSVSQWAGPPMTTVHVPIAAMAEQAVRVLTQLRAEPPRVYHRIDIPTTLVIRESSAPPA